MNESQESCTVLFECSCKELDDLTQLARDAGALGSRLTGTCLLSRSFLVTRSTTGTNLFSYFTGAGWGGCTVSLVPANKVDSFIQKIRNAYQPYRNLDDIVFSETVFATKPGRGAFGT